LHIFLCWSIYVVMSLGIKLNSVNSS
jgi:hypothetical protein